MRPATLLARSNSVRADKLVRWLGWRNSEDAEHHAYHTGATTAYQFSHIVVGVKGPTPRVLRAAGLSMAPAGPGVTYFGGTLAQWREVVDTLPATQHRLRDGLVAAIAHHTVLIPFGPARYYTKGNSVVVPKMASDIPGSAAAIFGGILVATIDRRVLADLEGNGAVVLTIPAHKDPITLRSLVDAGGARDPGGGSLAVPPAVTPIGSLDVPIDPRNITDADRALLERFEAIYRQVVPKFKSTDLTELFRLPFEAQDVLLFVDGLTLQRCADSPYPPTRSIAAALTAVLAGPERGTIGPPD